MQTVTKESNCIDSLKRGRIKKKKKGVDLSNFRND